MKSKFGLFMAVALGLFLFSISGCNTKSVGPSIVTYSYVTPIINPPDTFRVAYNVDISGNHIAYITFQDSAVWKIKALSETRVSFGFINPANKALVYIKGSDTIGFRANIKYSFIANDVSGDTTNNTGLYYVKFTKLPLDYSTFSPKY